jgi:class 3 adenylate cyclase
VPEERRERKVITILFADLVGFTSRAEQMDPEDVAAELSRYQGHVRGELERYGGTVEKFIGDAAMAIFGAPVAHEDDPERAVRAALAIRDWAREQGIEVRIGVNTGEALVTVDARPEAGETMAAGDVVNTAARLQSAAPVNSIAAGEQTFRATERAIEYPRSSRSRRRAGPSPSAPGRRSPPGRPSRSSASTARRWSGGGARSTCSRARSRGPWRSGPRRSSPSSASPASARAGSCSSCTRRSSATPS